MELAAMVVAVVGAAVLLELGMLVEGWQWLQGDGEVVRRPPPRICLVGFLSVSELTSWDGE